MAEVRHRLRKQTLRATVGSEALAIDVRSRLEALNRSLFLPIIERVFDEYAGADIHVRLDRLQLDLGDIPFADIDRVVASRFESVLRDQLVQALHGRDAQGSPRAQTRSPAEARAEALEHLLLTGTLPFWAAHGRLELDEAVAEWLAADPSAVRRLFARHRMNDRLLRRVVFGLSEATLRQLLHALSPEDAAVMIVYLTEIRTYHRIEPLIPATDDALGRVLWTVTLAYVVQDPGSQFNRKSFVQRLLAGAAASERLTYQDILSVFDLGLTPALANLPMASTLLEVVSALVADERRADPAFVGAARWHQPDSGDSGDTDGPGSNVPPFEVPLRYEIADALRYYLRFGQLPWSTRLRYPAFSPADWLTRLPELPVSLLASVADDLAVEERIERWFGGLRLLTEDQLEILVGSLARDRPELRALAGIAGINDGASGGPRAERLAHALASTLAPEADADRRIDLSTQSLPLTAVPEAAHLLRSRLTSRVLPTMTEVVGDDHRQPSSLEILSTLIAEAPQETRRWLRELRSAGYSPATLVDAPVAATTLELVRQQLPGEAGDAVLVLLEMLASLPPSLRPGTDGESQRMLLEEILAAWSSGATGVALQQRVLARLFPPAASADVQQVLRGVVEQLGQRGRISDASRIALGESLLSPGSEPEAAAVDAETSLARSARRRSDLEVLAVWLRRDDGAGDRDGSTYARETLNDLLHRMTPAAWPKVTAMLARDLSDRRARRRWVRRLSEGNLSRVFAAVAGGDGRRLLDAAERLFAASARERGRHHESGQRSGFWLFLFDFLANTPPSARTLDRLTHQFFAYAGRQGGEINPTSPTLATGATSTPAPTLTPAPASPSSATSMTGPAAGDRVWREARAQAERDGDVALQQMLGRDRTSLLHAWDTGTVSAPPPPTLPAPAEGPPRPAMPALVKPAAPPPVPATPSRARTAFSLDSDGDAVGRDPIYIANAGLVIAAPFLPRLFQMLEMIDSSVPGRPRLKPAQVSRAVHLLQWAVNGRTDTPEPELCLNKLLCGVSIAVPVEPAITPTAAELEIGHALVNSIIANWTIIKNTSIDGLRETFLQREGRLERVANGWRLEVQRKTVDVLLDQLPWSISTIVHSLMPEPIFVKW